ncbi:MAG TPA: archaemetzincin [Candidatus Sulfotelmatobacter sp.]|nr:archaemetzincin [Candidatus Sulfotelmatobacter sp.]
MNALYLVAIGNVPSNVMDWIEHAATDWYPLPIRRLASMQIPEHAFETTRKQYQSVEFLKLLARSAPPDAARILGVTDVDLSIPMLSFLFGQAQLDGPVAVVSLCRLRQEFYGLPMQEEVLRERTIKEVLHELGHTFGLVHCGDPKCPMSLATHVALVDSKEDRYCARCGIQLVERFSAVEGGV